VTDGAWTSQKSSEAAKPPEERSEASTDKAGSKSPTASSQPGPEKGSSPTEVKTPPKKVTKPTKAKEPAKPIAQAPAVKDDKKEAPATDDKSGKSLTGEVVASSPKSLSIRVTEAGRDAEVINIRVGLKTRFIPFRRPAVGERVKVDYRTENDEKFGYTVQVVQ
jgi:hypothetical protein